MKKAILLVSFLMLRSAFAAPLATRYLQRIDKPEEMSTLDFKNKVTLLVFWKADCAGCKTSMAQAASLNKKFSSSGLLTFGVFSDSWVFYADRGGVQIASDLPQLHDAAFLLKDLLQVKANPAWVAVGAGGEILGHAESQNDIKSLEQKISDKLKESR